MTRALRVTSFATVAALAVALAACSSSGSKASSTKATTTTSAPTTSAPTTAPTSTPSANPLATAPPPGSHFAHTLSFVKIPNGGLVLVGPNGHSLYLFDKDHGTTSACTGACTRIWPAFAPSGSVTVAPGLQAAKVTKSAAGQVAYNGHLLYYFSADRAPGDTNGVTLPGWHVVSPLGFGMAGR
jgi:predicted lipoprotein with Yx(FWY)xxD motif